MMMSLQRQEKFGYGDVFCKQCWKMFKDKRLSLLDYNKCKEHGKKIGYRLVDILKDTPTLFMKSFTNKKVRR